MTATTTAEPTVPAKAIEHAEQLFDGNGEQAAKDAAATLMAYCLDVCDGDVIQAGSMSFAAVNQVLRSQAHAGAS